MSSHRSLVSHIYDAVPTQIPAKWDEPPQHVAEDFSAATTGERALAGLMSAKDLVVNDPEKLVGHLHLSEGTKRLRLSAIFEDEILLSRLPSADNLLYFFQVGYMFAFRANPPYLFFSALWKLHIGFSRSNFSGFAYSKKDWNRQKRIVADPAAFGNACEHLQNVWDEIDKFVLRIREAALQSFNSWPDDVKRSRQFSWPQQDKVVLSVPPLCITIDYTFLACADMIFKH